MFKEAIKVIGESFNKYFGYSSMFIIFVIALIYLLAEENEKNNRKFLICYTLIIFMIALNPLFEIICSPILTSSIYFRVFLLIPFGIVIAYMGANLATKPKNKMLNVVIAICFTITIMYSGNLIYNSRSFYQVDNLYKIPDEIIEIDNIINTTDFKNKKVMSAAIFNTYIRQYDAKIYLAYQRTPDGNYEKYPILTYYRSGDVENLCNLCHKKDINIIVYDKNIPLTISPNYYGYKDYAQTENYIIYILEE